MYMGSQPCGPQPCEPIPLNQVKDKAPNRYQGIIC